MSSQVKLLSKLTIVSRKPIEPNKSSPLTPLDHAMANHTLHLIFYFSSSSSLDFDSIRPALCETLTDYPNATGRLSRKKGKGKGDDDDDDNWVVKWTDSGIRMVRAKVEGVSVDEWLRTGNGVEEMELVSWEVLGVDDDPGIWSPFRIQLNEFEGGGLAIGLSCTHLLADPTSATLLFKAWTDINRGEAIGHPPLFHLPDLIHAQSAPKTGSKVTTYYESKVAQQEPPSVTTATATFDFCHSIMEQHLSRIQDDFPKATVFDLLTALFWTRIVPMKKPRDGKKESLSMCIDFRKRLHPSLPYGYFGNALHFSQIMLDREDLEGGDLGRVVDLVHRHISGIEEDDIRLSMDWFSSRKDEKGKYGPAFRMYGPELTCVNMEDMIGPTSEEGTTMHPFMYMAMFNKGVKPDHVSYRIGNADGEGLILVMPSPEERLARRVAVTLPEEQIAKLLEDEVILSLQPKLLLSGRR